MLVFYFFVAAVLGLTQGCNHLQGGAPSYTQQNNNHQGPTPVPSPTPVSSPSPSPTPTSGKKRVFITSTYYAGNMGGLAGADSICQSRATAAGLGGVWVAWLSDGQNSAINRVKDVSPWYLVDNTTLVFPTKNAITASGPSVPINMTELGSAPPIANTWTATTPAGAKSGNTCQSWTTSDSRTLGDTGQVGTGNAWTQNGNLACNLGSALYCFEQ